MKLTRRKFMGSAAVAAGAGLAVSRSVLGGTETSKAAKADSSSAITIEVELKVENGKLVDRVKYSRESPRMRKERLLETIRAEKKSRAKTYVMPYGDHSEHLEHDSIITKPGDRVVWTSSKMFMLYMDYDLGVCDSIADTPRNPFGWNGVQLAKKVAGVYQVEGIALANKSLDQKFYKFTAMTEGAEALDPDLFCDR